MQFDYEFEDKLVRVIWVEKHTYDKTNRSFKAYDYTLLAEFVMGGRPEIGVDELMDNNMMPWGDKLWTESMAFEFIFDHLFRSGNPWPEIEFDE